MKSEDTEVVWRCRILVRPPELGVINIAILNVLLLLDIHSTQISQSDILQYRLRPVPVVSLKSDLCHRWSEYTEKNLKNAIIYFS